MTKEKNSIGLLAKTVLSVVTGVGIFVFFRAITRFGDFIGKFTNGWEAFATPLLLVFPFALVISAAFVAHKNGRKELAKALVLGMGAIFPLLAVGYLVYGWLILGWGG